MSELKRLLEDYLHTLDSLEKASVVSMLIEEVFKSGFDATALEFFSNQYDLEDKRKLIDAIFEELEYVDKIKEYELIDTLSSFLIETTRLIQDQILPVYLEKLSHKRDFKLVFTTLKIFTSKWREFSDELKKKLFYEFLVILENPVDIFIEEGIYEITRIILRSKSSTDPLKPLFSVDEMEQYLEKLVHLALESKQDSLNAALTSIKELILKFPSLKRKPIFSKLSSLFKKLNRRIAFFYPAKRRFIKMALDYLDLILLFEGNFWIEDLDNDFKKLMGKMVSKIDHADIKYLLELILTILTSTQNISKIKVLQPSLKILKSLYQKQSRMDPYLNILLRDIFNKLWPLLGDQDKDAFFADLDLDHSLI